MPRDRAEALSVFGYYDGCNGRYFLVADMLLENGMLIRDVTFDTTTRVAVEVNGWPITVFSDVFGQRMVEFVIFREDSDTADTVDHTRREAFALRHAASATVMAPPTATPPIFVFADDVLVHASIFDVGQYHEAADAATVKAVFDWHGNALCFDWAAGGLMRPIIPLMPPVNRWGELVLRLREHMLSLTVARPDLFDAEWVRHAQGEELVQKFVDFELRAPRPRKRRHWWPFGG